MSDHLPDPSSKALEEFVQHLARCQRQVFLYALSLTHSTADAEDVLQETNLVLWKKWSQFQPGTDFAKWACQIAHYEVLAFRERQARQRRVLNPEVVHLLAAESTAALDEVDRRREAMEQCKEKLSRPDRELVLARYQPGANTRTLAEQYGRSEQAIRRSIHRVRQALLECIRRTMAQGEHG